MRLLVKGRIGSLTGELHVPVSKYHAHRALILASLAPGTTRIQGLSDAGHVQHTIQALRQLGTEIQVGDDGDTLLVTGGQYRPVRERVSVGSSGTTLYFLTPLVALAAAPVTIVGQKYFRRRPIRPLLGALEGLGVRLDAPTGTPPISVAPRVPTGGRVRIPGTLSQWISGLLLLAPFATGPSLIEVTGPFNERSYVGLTIAMMRRFGLVVETGPDGRTFAVEPNQRPHPAVIELPPDIGSAAFGLAASALRPSNVLFRGLSAVGAAETDHPEADLLDILTGMGLPLRRDPGTGFVRVQHDGLRLRPVSVDCRSVPDMLPVLTVLASQADGTSTLDSVDHVRLKESDRVAAMLQLNQMGARLDLHGDQLRCHGVSGLTAAELSSFNDHRVLMALAVAASQAEGESRLTYPNAYRISYPRFVDEMNAIGMSMSVESGRKPDRRRDAQQDVIDPGRIATEPLDALVGRWARRRPDDPAVVEAASPGRAERCLTWRELDQRADAAASMLLELGVEPGEPVAWQLPNWTESVVLTIATLRIGAVCCPLMPIFRERELRYMLGRARARVVVVPEHHRGRDHARELAALLTGPEAPAVRHVLVVAGDGPLPEGGGARWHRFDEALARQRPDRGVLDARRPAPDMLAQLLFTSGTTGEPKGVLHRMETLTRAAAMAARHLGLTRSDRVFVPSPLAHQTGFLYGMWLALTLGVPHILQPVWDGPAALATLRRWHGTFVQAATPFLVDLVAAVESTGRPPADLRIFVATGAAVPRALAERATRVLDAAVCGAWGTTETCLGTLGAPGDEPASVWGTDGRALAGVGIRVTDDAGAALGPGQEGVFEVVSDCLFAGYLDHPDWTAAAMTSDGWYRSGDLAVIDESGFVRITGRVKDVINRGGEKIPVAEIEQLLHAHPSIADVAIVAMPDERLGERACAYVVRTGDIDFAEVQHFLDEQKVAKQYWPERLEIIDELPRNPVGKVQKFLLREWASR
ncbi:3-phosphoshikimate 1-carboxyvinyltransferase [Micromonospora coxensis]|uniref:3-phosphoshikimate 1-carboxyvinyltransferase n=1 Tax=Micromonospora coxensis TaxID=356852 RepID=A0A1C5K3S8_9ACTN|nr:3-phosphoshikimate 1-carboxyvinyltransferase [Micromonospora coxensis]SCG76976.1 3-phosphoshikimate 1-carboxyvinyltransferase [Micromonospora coxensis]